MDLIQSMLLAKETGGLIKRDQYTLLMKYEPTFKCYVWCWENGKIVADESDKYKVKRVILSHKLLHDDWYIIYIQ